jgi:hypothetical protein
LESNEFNSGILNIGNGFDNTEVLKRLSLFSFHPIISTNAAKPLK